LKYATVALQFTHDEQIHALIYTRVRL